MKSSNYRTGWYAACIVAGLSTSGCLSRSTIALPDMPLPATALASVTGNPSTAIMAIGGTQQLSANGVTFAGSVMTAFDSVLYQYASITDSSKVRLSPSGLATGIASTGASTVLINVIAFKGLDIRGDRVVLQVTPTVVAGPLIFSLQPVAPDSARLAVGSAKGIIPVLRNSNNGLAVATPAVRLTVKGTDSARVDVYRGQVVYFPNHNSTSDKIIVNMSVTSNSLLPNQFVPLTGEGTAWLYGAVNAYGTLLQDSVQYTFSYPFTRTISTVKANLALVNLYAGQVLTLTPGATVTFQNGLAAADPLTMIYTFDTPAAATVATPASTIGGASGNVTTLTGGQTSNRKFLTPGTVHWTMTPSGGPAPWPGQTLSGTIVTK